MTELTVTASAFLVPMFLVIPMIGKMIDMKQTAIQTARYEAWEYTAWYEDIGDASTGFSAALQPEKSFTWLSRESRRRTFGDSASTLAANDGATAFNRNETTTLWRDHRGGNLFSSVASLDGSTRGQTATEPAVILAPVAKVIDWVLGAIKTVLGALGVPATFDAFNLSGQFTAEVDIPVSTVARLGPFDPTGTGYGGPYVMHAQAAVLSDTWNAGGKDHAQRQESGLVLTSLLNNGPIRLIQTILSFLIAPELGPSSLIFGYTDSEGIHPDRLEGGTPGQGHSCDKGFCKFN